MRADNRRLSTVVSTVLALLAFAANSILCRMALEQPSIDAASFSTVRLVSGAVTLLLILAATRSRRAAPSNGNWLSAFMLFLYVTGFSFAYLSLSAGTGALILFGAVQISMIASALWTGERPHPVEWLGLAVALAGLVYLVSPGLAAPSPQGAAFMAVAGIAWGVYSLRGRGAVNPLGDTAGNFLRSVPFVAGVSLLALGDMKLSQEGVLLAALSGSVASGAGYVVWYAALKGLTATRAATVQLSVPVIAALAGVVLLDEVVTLRLSVAAMLILGGVGLAIASNLRRQTRFRSGA